MPKSIIAGLNGPTDQGIQFTWNNREGYKAGGSIKGPSAAMKAYPAALVAAGIAHSVSESGGIITIQIQSGGTVEVGQSEAPIDSWQLVNNIALKDIYESPNALVIEAAKAGSLGAIRDDVTRYNTNLPPNTFVYDTGTAALKNQLFYQLVRGVTHFQVNQPVLRHTQTVGDRYNGNGVNLTNPLAVYTTDQLLVECANFPFPLPAVYRNIINAIPTKSATDYLFGWVKQLSSVTTTANYKSEVNTEFTLDLWTTFLYSGFTSA